MPEGTCFCGKIRVSYTIEPANKDVCHCLDCKKISGSTYTMNFPVPEEDFKLMSGNPKSISKIADSGKRITNCFCGDCGTTLYRETESVPGVKLIQAGIMADDPQILNKGRPIMELYSTSRVDWVPAIPGAKDHPTMP